MGTILVSEIIAEVAEMLLDNKPDQGQRRWKDKFHLASLNNGQQAIVGLRPDAYPLVAPIDLAPGIRQQVPAGYNQLIDLRYNLDADGTTPLSPIRHIAREELNKRHPTWLADDPQAEVLYFFHDPRYPRFFDVYPPQPTSDPGKVEAVLAGRPPTVTLAAGEKISVEDRFAEALKYYMLARGRATDGSGMTNWAKARDIMQLYYQELGMEKAAAQEHEPRPETPTKE